MNQFTTINVTDFLNEQPFSRFQWAIFGLCFCVVLFDGFDAAAIGYVAPSLLQEWGIGRAALGPVLSSAIVGLIIGSLITGPLGDLLGRKKVLVVSVLVFGIASVVSAMASSLEELVIWRAITGIGLGASMPNAVTLLSEYCPDRRRALITNAVFCGFPLGASLGGFLAAWIIPVWGWRSVLVVGGAVPVLLVVLLALILPESVRYMTHRGYPAERIRSVLRRISASAANAERFVITESNLADKNKGALHVVLSRRYLVGTVSLWTAYFMGLVIFYSLINWMPLLFKDAGIAPRTATLIAALFPLGGVGSLFFGWLMDRFEPNRVVAIGFLLTGFAIFAIGQSSGSVGLLVTVVFFAGAIMNTSHVCLPSLAAAFYPTAGRATGISWMLGLGRFGGIAGSFLVAELTYFKLGFSEIFAVLAIPGLLASGAIFVKLFTYKQPAGDQAATSLCADPLPRD